MALIEVVGAGARATVGRLLEAGALPDDGRAAHRWLVDATGARLDDALVVAWGTATAPRIELGVHGGPAVVAAVLAALGEAGARVVPSAALPLFGAVDPIAASAWRRVRRVRTAGAMRVLGAAWSGALQRSVTAALATGGEPLERLVRDSARVDAWFRPVRAVLVGPPNAGKSSLFNALLGRERATVSPEAGTTRDAVDDRGVWNDRVVHLVDTAGDAPPALLLARADVVVAVGAPPPAVRPGTRVIPVVSRVDVEPPPPDFDGVATSAVTGQGLGTLRDAIAPPIDAPVGPALFTRLDRRLLERVRAGDEPAGRRLRRRAGDGVVRPGWRLSSGEQND